MNFSKINELKPYDLNCNIFDVYSYDGLSMQELLCQFFTKINECIKTSNETIDLAEWLVNEGLKQEVAIKLTNWLNDGTLENLINVTLFENLNKKIDDLKSQLTHIATINFVTDCNGFNDGLTDNTQAFINLSSKVNKLKGNCKVLFPSGKYVYRPSFNDGSWRSKVEFVDVENVFISGYGAEIVQINNPLWSTGSRSGCDQEGVLCFRQTREGGCKNIKIEGLKIQGGRVRYDGKNDGNIFGIAIKGAYDIILKDLEINGWITEGIYIGTGYSNLYKSKNVFIENCKLDNNGRQGIAITGCDDFVIKNCIITNTEGNSFGHGIDLEANSPEVNTNGLITGCILKNNERGAIDFINTKDVIFENCIIEDKSDGAIRNDGNTSNIIIKNNIIKSDKAGFYFNGSNINNIRIEDNNITTLNKPNNNATVRINPDGSAININDLTIKNNKFYGTGGVLIKADGTCDYSCNYSYVSLENSNNTNCFDLKIECYCNFNNNTIIIKDDVKFDEKLCYIKDGVVENNYFKSHSNAICNIRDKRGSSFLDDVVIGRNVFTNYFYYKGEHAELDVKKESIIIQYSHDGRLVHGGYRRTVSGKNEVDDIVKYLNGTTEQRIYKCTESGTPGTWIRIV